MKGTEMLAHTRYLIEETTADEHTDAQIQTSLNAALAKYSAKLARSTGDWYFTSCSVTLTADTNTATLPDGSLYDSATRCNGHVYGIEEATSGSGKRPLDKGVFNRFDPTDTGNPLKFDLKGRTLYFDEYPTSDFSLKLYYYYTPTIDVTDSTDEIDFPDSCHELLCIEAAIKAMIRIGEDISTLLALKQEALEIFRMECGHRVHGSTHRIGDDGAMDDSHRAIS